MSSPDTPSRITVLEEDASFDESSCSSLKDDRQMEDTKESSEPRPIIKHAQRIEQEIDECLASLGSQVNRLRKIARGMEKKQERLEEMQAIRELKLLTKWSNNGY